MSALVDRTVWSAAYDTTLSVSGVQNVYEKGLHALLQRIGDAP
jgi:hypothetical protein